MGVTSDPNDPRLTHGPDDGPTPQAEVYLVLSDEERARGFVRPLRTSYTHVGPAGPTYDLRDLTLEEIIRFGGDTGYVKYEPYPPPIKESAALGRFWTQAQLDAIGKGCGASTRMATPIAETYARQPNFYGATYCVSCARHLPVAEFTWDTDGSRLGS